MSSQPLPGFRDFYPADFAFRAHIFETWRQVASRYGFEEYDGPPLEPLELYTAKSGAEIVGQLYNFIDKGDRPVSLRPEMTPTVARMVAARAGGMKKPIRWFSIAQFFRYERQQRGRLREFFQLNCDLMGEASPLADAELVALAIDLMRAFGLGATDVRVRISDRRIVTAVLDQFDQTEEQRAVWFQVLDKFGRTPEEESRRKLAEAGVSEEAIAWVLGLHRHAAWPGLEDRLLRYPRVRDAFADLFRVKRALDAMGIGDFVDFDFTIVRGLAYYTGTVFEVFDAAKSLRAILGGGRYDNLLGNLGGVEMPAVGFAIGDVVLGELLKDRGLAPPQPPSIDLFLAAIGEEDQAELLKLAHALRDAGVRVEYSLAAGPVGKQLKLADARRAALAIVIGPDDRAKGEVQLKDLRNKGQSAVKLADVVGVVRAVIQSTVDSRQS
ncbi:MAG TPA: histidine--tRNA ligase [Gemmatimonadales bacterium]|nr:histidine--tRNA ligase [Gemmatimonadales bacterium]